MATNAESPLDWNESAEDIQAVAYLHETRHHVQPAERAPLSLALTSELTSELTLCQLEQIALTNNPSLAEARARVEGVRGKRVQVGLPPSPHVGFSDQQLGSGGVAEQYGIYIGQEFVRGGKLRLNRDVASQEIEVAEQQWTAQQQRVLTDVRLGYYEVLIAQRRAEVSERILQIADEVLNITEKMFAAKETSQIEVVRSQLERQSAELTLRNSHTVQAAAWSRLAAVLGTPDIQPQSLVGDVEAAALDLQAEAALARLLSESPEMGAALAEVDRARSALARSCVEPIPNLSVQTIAQHDNSLNSANGNLQLTMPIPWLNRNQGGIRQSRAELLEAEQAVGRVELSLKRRLATIYQQYASARNQVEQYRKPEGILDKSKAMLDLVEQGFRAGELNYLDVVLSQRQYSQSNLAYVEALGELWVAIVEIDGLLLKDSLQSSH